MLKRFKRLSHEQRIFMARLSGGVALLVLCAVGMSSTTLKPQAVTAATWLGDQQGVPPTEVGQAYPDQTICWVNNTPGYGAVYGPVCNSNLGAYSFYSQVLSAHPSGSSAGQTAYSATSYNTTPSYTKGAYLGPSTGVDAPHFDCNPAFNSMPAGYSKANGDFVDGTGDGCFAYHIGYASPTYVPYGGPRVRADCNPYQKLPLPSGFSAASGDYVDVLLTPDNGPDGGWISDGKCYAWHRGSTTGNVFVGPAVADVNNNFMSEYVCAQYVNRVAAGYFADSAPDGNCYQYAIVSPIQTGAATVTGSAASVGAGGQLTLEWSCLPSRQVNWESKQGTGTFDSGSWVTGTYYTITLGPSSQAMAGPGFTTGGAGYGSATIVAPSTAGSYTYSMQCTGGTWALPTISVSVTVVPPTPTVTITGNGANPATAYVGQNVTIAATFTPASGDTLAKTAINDYLNSLWCGSGNTCSTSMWTQAPMSNKSYTFTPAAAGTYTFYPSVQTNYYPAWSNYSQALTLTVAAACPNGQGPAGGCTSCNAGYVLSGGNCVVQCPNGQGPTGSCTSCNAGYVLVGSAPNNSCQVQCANGQGPAGSCTSCNAGYVLQGGYCIQPSGSITQQLTATPSRVRKGGSISLAWATTGMASCTLTDEAGATLSSALTSGGLTVSNIINQKTFTLRCTDGVNTYTSTKMVTVSPTFKEI